MWIPIILVGSLIAWWWYGSKGQAGMMPGIPGAPALPPPRRTGETGPAAPGAAPAAPGAPLPSPLPYAINVSHPKVNGQISIMIERPGAHLAATPAGWITAPQVNQEIFERLLARGYRTQAQGYRPIDLQRVYKDLLVTDVGSDAGIPRALGPGLTVFGG